MKIPGIMLTAMASGSGKTAVTCALLAALKNRGKCVAACKCGPDYIDPMFHRKVIGVESENLDLFFCNEVQLRSCFQKHATGADIAVIEGVMGYYDGMGMESDKASSYDIARTLQVPSVLVFPCRGMALSSLAVLKGMLEFRKDSNIKGIIFNRISPSLYPKMKALVEQGLNEMGHEVKVLGYVPEHPAFQIESRHLGLTLPEEIEGIKRQLEEAAQILEQSADLDALVQLADSDVKADSERKEESDLVCDLKSDVVIAVARDAAFGFYYKENLELIKESGCRILYFSPLNDHSIPEAADGILLGGGYPEAYAKTLSENREMLADVKKKLDRGMPCIAECGGFMYLLKNVQGMDGKYYPMAGVFPGNATKQNRLIRFGYMNVKARENGLYLKKGETIRGHEFHYWEADQVGTDCIVTKPDGKRSWEEIFMKDSIFAGYPHLYWSSRPEFIERFVEECRRRKTGCKN
ncbi:MAG: cobyrinate a,c-diamide synthase [Bariatricus sp.]|nr:cobyrinate a,c-diamide synthase [Bariatricus sp.]